MGILRNIFTIAGRFLIGFYILLVALGAVGAVYQAAATEIDKRKFPPPGEMVDVGGYKLHIYCTGAGSPTVILDALFPGTVSNWAWVQPEIAKTTRVCAYDRAGLGWSELGPEPRDARHHAQELHTLLQNAAVEGPYILVGHSLGGLSVQMFANEYPAEILGLALIEGTLPDSWKIRGLPEGVGADRNMLAMAPFVARLGIFRLGHFLPYAGDPDLPPRQQSELDAYFNTVKSLQTIRMVDQSFSASLDQVRHRRNYGSLPLLIVLGTNGDGSQEVLKNLFFEQAKQSTNSRVVYIDGATHAGLVDNQGHAAQTTGAIMQLIEEIREKLPPAEAEQ